MAEQPPLQPEKPPGQGPNVGSAAFQQIGYSWGAIPQMSSGMTFGEYGQTGLRQFSGWVREEFLPNLVGRQGARTYREMADNSPIIGGMLFAIRSTMRKVEWRVIPANDSGEAQEKADFVESMMGDMTHTWDDLVDENLSMLQYGFAVHEIVYTRRLGRKPGPDPKRPGHTLPRSAYDDGLVAWRRIPIRGQETVLKWFFDEYGQVKGVTQQPWTGAIVDLPIEKCLLFRPTAAKGNPEGRSVLRNAWRPYHFTKRIEEQEAILFERMNGVPIVRVPSALIEQARAGNGEALATLNAYKMMATNLRLNEQMGILLSSATYESPTGGASNIYQYDIELMTPEIRRTGATPDEVLRRYAVQMMTSVIADFLDLGHGARGTQALADNKVDMFFQAIEGFLDANAAIYNRHALPRVWDLNGWDADLMPEISPDLAQRIDLDVLSNFVMRLSQSGMPLFPNEELQSYLLDAAGLPDLVDPMAMQAAGLSEEQVAQQTAVDLGQIPDPKQVQQQALMGPPQPAGASAKPNGSKPPAGEPKPPSNLEKMIRAGIARRVLRLGGNRFEMRERRKREHAEEKQ